MADKLWDKGFDTDKFIEEFTVGRDREMDMYLARFDVLGSLAHIRMLTEIGLLAKDELSVLTEALREIYRDIREGRFVIEDGVEDVHSQVELLLTRKLGDTGKKIHSGRSRNDQVLVDMKLFTRDAIRRTALKVRSLIGILLRQSEKYRNILMPGYTHLQIAMPSSFGLWFGAYAESLTDDLTVLEGVYRTVNRNPLGSAAGYGSSFPLKRQMTTDLLGFDSMDYNVVYAQMCRGKMERTVAAALSSIAQSISKLSFDACMFNSQNFGFITLPKECTTGSSIMPHKKNPDVFELLRARCNRLAASPWEIQSITSNLPSGYFRDMQLTKEIFIPLFTQTEQILDMACYITDRIGVREDILSDSRYDAIFSVERVNSLVWDGVPFRDAYRQVAAEIESGEFVPDRNIRHTHEGSIGNLCNDRIEAMADAVMEKFRFDDAIRAEKALAGE